MHPQSEGTAVPAQDQAIEFFDGRLRYTGFLEGKM
jgi:hypothetical protein